MENSWIVDIKNQVPKFLANLRGRRPGFFRYSWSGDRYGDDAHWGLGNTVFATKIFYTLGILAKQPAAQQRAMADFIESFRASDGSISDPYISGFRAQWRRTLQHPVAQPRYRRQVVRAETRQAMSALELLKRPVKVNSERLPHTPQAVERFLSRLNWQAFWNAGGHFSHMIFFLQHSQLPNRQNLIQQAVNWVMELQHKEDGAWYTGSPSPREKINGAMKVLTGLNLTETPALAYPDRLIDYCLANKNDHDACDNINVPYVLRTVSLLINESHRMEHIQHFALSELDTIRHYYSPEFGGFSFHADKASDSYYGVPIFRGLLEPDIHGTCMFLWGITLICKINKLFVGNEFQELTP